MGDMRVGLREAKKAALERQLAAVSFELVSDRRFADVTIDDIVERANVSRRTFSNYFCCKEEAVATVAIHRAEKSLSEWSPVANAPLIAMVRQLVQHQFASGALGTIAQLAALTEEYPPFLPYFREAQWQMWARAADRVLEVTGSTDAAARTDVMAVMGALYGVVDAHWTGADGDAGLAGLGGSVGRVLDRLETAFS